MIAMDLNADLGEGYGLYTFGSDEQLLESISSANIACGYHAGDPHRMRETAERCLARGIAVGAHPGLPDRLGFGRREMSVTAEEACDYVLYQTGALQAFVRAAGGTLGHVKLHGALYHMAMTDKAMADAIVQGLCRLDRSLMLFGLPGSRLEASAIESGMTFVAEGFADRAYMPDGSLAPRSLPGAVLHDDHQAAEHAVSLAVRGEASTIDGGNVPVIVRTLCIHGDAPNAAERANRIRQTLEVNGVQIRSPKR